MDYTTVYEVTGINNVPISPIIATFFVILALVMTIPALRSKEAHWARKIYASLFTLVAAYISFNTWNGFYHYQNTVTKPYLSGDYEVAEGVVEDLKVTYEKDEDSTYEYKDFTVEGKSFRFPDEGNSSGCSLVSKNDETITGDGQQVRIRYICIDKGDNIIMKLEIAY